MWLHVPGFAFGGQIETHRRVRRARRGGGGRGRKI